MEEEEITGIDNILNSNSPKEESILDTGNDDIKVIPHWRTAISEGIAVTYGPDPMIISFSPLLRKTMRLFLVLMVRFL